MRKSTTESFVKKSKLIHGDRYDYSRVNYINAWTKVCIVCRVHGEFYQTPHGHLRGDGCIKCSGLQKKSTEQFISDAIAVHGEKYDYRIAEYKNNSTPVKIMCPSHGEFLQTPNCHLSGEGCPICGGTQRHTNSNFINLAKKVHGDKYDYSQVEYTNGKTKICIVCPSHGEFWQTPSSHLSGSGCSICANEAKSNAYKKDLSTFIAEAKALHGDKFDYSQVEYNGNNIKVSIICPFHGKFRQTPHAHLSGKGCPKCNGFFRTTEEFVALAKEIHGNKYDYSKVMYCQSNREVCIVCPTHGDFWQTPHSHLSGAGCPSCFGSQKLTNEEFVRRARLVHGTKYGYDNIEYKSAFDRVCITCPKHGDFWQGARAHLRGAGCPSCNNSILEDKTREALSKNNIHFVEQKTFAWLRYKKSMRLDYYLPDYDIAIECQGIQHFEPVETFGGQDEFRDTQLRDIMKREKCQAHGIKIIYYSNLKIRYPYPVYENLDEMIHFIQLQLLY